MAEFVIDADGHIMEDHKDIFAHIRGNFSEMNWHSTWPMFDADGWQRGLSRKGKREDPDAAAWLTTARRVRAVGIDTASIDRGASRDFRAHRALANANVPIFENLTALGALPARGATFVGLPMKIAGGSGGPLRAIALVP